MQLLAQETEVMRPDDNRSLVIQNNLEDGSMRFVILERTGGLIEPTDQVMGWIILDRERAKATRDGQAGPMVQATMGKAKVAGLIVERREVCQTNVYKDMSDEDLRDLIRADAEALGIDLAKLARRD